MNVDTICRFLDQEYPPFLQEEYDNCGLLVGDFFQEISSALVCLDVTEEVLNEAIQRKCQLIISHHPLIFKAIKKITGSNSTQRIIARAIRHHISIYALHTNLDNSFSGLNAVICSKLGLTNTSILRPDKVKLRKIVTFCPISHADKVREALFRAGAGKIGNYDSCSFNTAGFGTFRALDNANPFVGSLNELHHEDEIKIEAVFPEYLTNQIVTSMIQAHPYEEVAYDIQMLANSDRFAGSGMTGQFTQPMIADDFLGLLKSTFGTPIIRYSGSLRSEISKVAVCGGAGSFLIPDALEAKCQAFITADLKYHDFINPEGNLLLADVGHYESEQFAVDLIVDRISQKFSNFAALKSETNTNPVLYF